VHLVHGHGLVSKLFLRANVLGRCLSNKHFPFLYVYKRDRRSRWLRTKRKRDCAAPRYPSNAVTESFSVPRAVDLQRSYFLDVAEVDEGFLSSPPFLMIQENQGEYF